ncbi:MAG: 4Fe-4S binding protein, partial [Limnohabitans sp.]
MPFKLSVRVSCWFGVLFAVFLSPWANAGMLVKAEIDRLFEQQYLVGDIQPNLPVWPLFEKPTDKPDAKPVLKAYVFETVDFEPVRGYGGKPINVMVVMDPAGNYLASKLLDHKEPLFRSEAGIAKLSRFTEQYAGLSTQHNIQIFAHTATPRRDANYAALFGVQAGTVTAKAIDKTIVLSAASVAMAHAEAQAMGMIAGAGASGTQQKPVNESYSPLTWDTLLSRGMVSEQEFTRAQIEKPFAGTKSAGSDKLAAENPDEIALKLHVALVSVPAIGRNLLDNDGWRLLATNRRQAQALLVTESGPMSRMNYESQRIQEDLPFEVRQNGQTLKLRVMSYDKVLRVPGYPETTRAYFLVVDSATSLDPGSAFELDLKWGRRFGSFPNQVVNVSFPLNYNYHGWRAAWYGLLDTDIAEWEWFNAWQSRSVEIGVLLVALVVLTLGLVMQKRMSSGSRQLKWLRSAYLVFTLGFIGWYAQGQLTIVNITAALDELRHGGDLLFFMNDPMTVILWLFVAGSLLVWGRGTFCGWLCPFGAMQELISMVTQAVGLRHRRLKTVLDKKLKMIKYAVLVVILGGVWFSPSFAEVAAEVE